MVEFVEKKTYRTQNGENIKIKFWTITWLSACIFVHNYYMPYTHCDDFHESSPCVLIYLNTWSTVGEIVWEELVGMTFLEEVSLGLGFWSDMSTRILSNYHACLHHNDHCLTLQNYKQDPNKMFPFITSLGHAVASHNSNPN